MAASIKNIATRRSDLFHVPPSSLTVRDGWNTRDLSTPDNEAHVAELTASILEIGFRSDKPLTVFVDGENVIISDGHCRFAAVMRAIEQGAEIKTIPVVSEDRYSSEADRVFTQIVGNSGKPLTPLEIARNYRRLIGYGWTEREIAAKAGKSVQHVTDMLQLQAAPAEVQQLVASGAVSATLANSVLKTAETVVEATETLTAAVETAKKSGKAKATARDIGSTASGMTFKTEIRAIFGRATPMMGGYSFAPEDLARLNELVASK